MDPIWVIGMFHTKYHIMFNKYIDSFDLPPKMSGVIPNDSLMLRTASQFTRRKTRGMPMFPGPKRRYLREPGTGNRSAPGNGLTYPSWGTPEHHQLKSVRRRKISLLSLGPVGWFFLPQNSQKKVCVEFHFCKLQGRRVWDQKYAHFLLFFFSCFFGPNFFWNPVRNLGWAPGRRSPSAKCCRARSTSKPQ